MMHPSFQIEVNSSIGRAESGASSEDLTQRRKGAKERHRKRSAVSSETNLIITVYYLLFTGYRLLCFSLAPLREIFLPSLSFRPGIQKLRSIGFWTNLKGKPS
jgi:hypothetical protein